MANQSNDPLFGEAPPRALLSRAPLVRVLGQVRFPTLVKISEESYIGDFQEMIRREYPYLDRDQVEGVEINFDGSEVRHQKKTSIVWRFLDPKRIFRISLGNNSITLETAKYESRDDFTKKFGFILKCLAGTISPSHVQRVGFRYFNRIQAGEDMASLSDLIKPEMLGVLRPNLLEHVDFSMTELTGNTAEGKIIVRYGLAPKGFSHDPSMAPPVPVESWVLDIDSFSTACDGEAFDAEMLCTQLDMVAARAYAFFRWSVTDNFLEHFGRKEP